MNIRYYLTLVLDRIIAPLLLFGALILLYGCASPMPEHLQNRVACTVFKDQAYIVSMWGQIGVASYVHPADVAILCPLK